MEEREEKMRIMTEKPLNAETPVTALRSWITANRFFFDRNQGGIPEAPVSLGQWRLAIEGEVDHPLELGMEQILRMPRVMMANTLECSGNGRALMKEKSSGNPWTIGGVGNALYAGVWLRDILNQAGVRSSGQYVAFEGQDLPLGSAGIKFIRSIPLEKAMTTTLLAYEMNGEPLPLKHGYPLRALALGWTGANCVKWLKRIMVLAQPYEGFFMDKVYRVFQPGQASTDGEVVTGLQLKSFITQPLQGEELTAGSVVLLGVAYGGEADVMRVEVSVDGGRSWRLAQFLGPHEPFAWRQWQLLWEAPEPGEYTLLCRATDAQGKVQPMRAQWNVLGYGNNGVEEHAVRVRIR